MLKAQGRGGVGAGTGQQQGARLGQSCSQGVALLATASPASLPKGRVKTVDAVVDVAVDTPGH